MAAVGAGRINKIDDETAKLKLAIAADADDDDDEDDDDEREDLGGEGCGRAVTPDAAKAEGIACIAFETILHGAPASPQCRRKVGLDIPTPS